MDQKAFTHHDGCYQGLSPGHACPYTDACDLWPDRDALIEAIFSSTACIIIHVDHSFTILRINEEYSKIHQTASCDYVGKNFFDLHPLEGYEGIFQRVLQRQEPMILRACPCPADLLSDAHQQTYWDWNIIPVTNQENESIGLIIFLTEVTTKVEAEQSLQRLTQHHTLLLQTTEEGVVGLDINGVITFANSSALRMLGYRSEEIVNCSFQAFTRHIDEEGGSCPDNSSPVSATSRDGVSRRVNDETLWRKNGTSFPASLVSIPLFEQGELTGCIVLFQDRTEWKAVERRLRHQALHDALTNLPNRTLFIELLGHAMRYIKRGEPRSFAVLFLDIDNFRVVNDSLGHMDGDQLLITTAGRLKACLRATDTVARFGSDEFVILLEDIEDINDVMLLVERIQRELARPLFINSHDLTVSACIGIAISNQSYVQSVDILRDADTALHRAKAMGPGHYAVFDIAMHDHVLRRLYTETALRRAIENDELLLYYQPIIAISSGRIAGFEALIRWQHPERGLLEPDEFIPTAEETGLCLALDSWVMHEACRQMSVWLHQFSTLPPLTVNINLSPRAFAGEDFIQRVRHVLQETSLAPTSLKLEITEETMMIHVDSTIATLVELREMGIQLCIDDFGTGYSSLRYLHRFPIHMLKIDKSFIWTLETSSESNAITQSIIMLSHTLGKEVVAEGVETVSQLNYLRELKCDYVQGYYFSRPVDPEHIEMLLAVEAGVAEKRVAHS